MSDVVASNVRRTREARGLTMRELSARLAEIGAPLLPSGLVRVESADPGGRRRVDVDDLVALALALNSSPWFLLSPRTDERVALTTGVQSRGKFVSSWLRGTAMIAPTEAPEGEDSPTYAEHHATFAEDAPPWVRQEFAERPDPAVLVLGRLVRLVSEAVDDEVRGQHDLADLAVQVRQQLDAVREYVGLLADELEVRARRQQAAARAATSDEG